jgi:hypothetical protein
VHSFNHLSTRARRAGISTLLASFTAFSLLSGTVPTAAAQSAPTISIADVGKVTEGDLARFQVTVHGDHPGLTVDFNTTDGTALAGFDYTPNSGTLSIGADTNDTTVEVDVRTVNDTVFEPNKTFHMQLKNSVYKITRAVGDATVVSNDPLPTIGISDARVNEGDPGGPIGSAVFEVSLSNPASEDVLVDYVTVDGTATGTPGLTLPGDYRSLKTATLTFPANTNPTLDVIVAVKGDNIHERNEKFSVQLSNARNAQLAGGGPTLDGTGTIVDDDPLPKINIDSNASDLEGDPGGPISQVGVNVTLSNPSADDVSFTYSTSNGSAHEKDYSAVPDTVVTIPAGSTSVRLWFQITPDDRKEGPESFFVAIKDPVNGNIGNGTCEVSITDDD